MWAVVEAFRTVRYFSTESGVGSGAAKSTDDVFSRRSGATASSVVARDGGGDDRRPAPGRTASAEPVSSWSPDPLRGGHDGDSCGAPKAFWKNDGGWSAYGRCVEGNGNDASILISLFEPFATPPPPLPPSLHSPRAKRESPAPPLLGSACDAPPNCSS